MAGRSAISQSYLSLTASLNSLLFKLKFIFNNNNNNNNNNNLHSTNAQVPEENETPAEMKNIFQTAKLVFASVAADPGDFSNRLLDSRTKKRPTNQDIININAAIDQLMKQNDVINAPDPAQNPFLWLANCVIYSVVVAFLVLKGWKKK